MNDEKLSWWAHLVTIVGFPVLILSILLAFYQLQDLNKTASSQNNIALNAQFFNDTNTGIIDAIENNKPILVENQGKYSDAQLDNYLGDFENIDTAYGEGLLTEDELCVSFSYYIGITSNNSEIGRYIAGQQKMDPGFFTGLAELEKIVTNSKDPNCH